jgi:hypothetical protein
MPVDGMSTRHFVTSISRTEEIFLTYRTVGHVLAGLTVVIIEQIHIDAHTTIMTVFEVIATPYTTKTTILAVIRLFFVGHPKVTTTTMVRPELSMAS